MIDKKQATVAHDTLNENSHVLLKEQDVSSAKSKMINELLNNKSGNKEDTFEQHLKTVIDALYPVSEETDFLKFDLETKTFVADDDARNKALREKDFFEKNLRKKIKDLESSHGEKAPFSANNEDEDELGKINTGNTDKEKASSDYDNSANKIMVVLLFFFTFLMTLWFIL